MRRWSPASRSRTLSTGIAAIVVQLGFATIPLRTSSRGIKRRARATPAEFGPLPEISPERRTLAGEMAEAVARAVTQLPAGQREALILAHYEQMPLAEISRVMEIEVTAVKSRLQRARAHLKEALAVYAPGAENRR